MPIFAREHGLPRGHPLALARARRPGADPAGDRPRQRQIRPGRAGQEVRDPRPRPLPADRRADADAEGQAQRGQREIRGPVRRAVRQLTCVRPFSCEHRKRCAVTHPIPVGCSSGAVRARRRSRFRTLPKRGSDRRQRVDGSLAGLMLAAITAAEPALLGADPARLPVARLAGRLSVGQRQPRASSSRSSGCSRCCSARSRSCGASTTPGSSCAAPPATISALGSLGRIFAITAVICALAFVLWFVVIHGPGTSLVVRGGGS